MGNEITVKKADSAITPTTQQTGKTNVNVTNENGGILSLSGTNAYYHLSLMLRANVIKARNQGRTVLYSINKQHFDVVCDILSKYSTKSERR